MNHLRKTLLLGTVLFGLLVGAEARPVTLENAKGIASLFMKTDDLHLAATYRTSDHIAALHVFNTPDGFVIVAADDCETPIIGYSHEGCFDPDDVPLPLEAFLQDFVTRIQYGIENRLVADKKTARQWERVKTSGTLSDDLVGETVAPLLTEKWHQGCLYNRGCPEGQGPCNHAEVGCVAVAMGQIMHYWRYPATGWGSHAYVNAGVSLSADFGHTLYDWDHMPDSLTDSSSEAEIEAIATLLFHCGVSVNMRYGANGSTASNDAIPQALSQYFDYSRRLHRETRTNYDDEGWTALLTNCLNLKQPILYSGFGNGGNMGHVFVCDGYDDNGLFHFNWGWGGNADGYYSLGNLTPPGYQFNNSNSALIDIVPHYDPCQVVATVHPSLSGTVEGTGEYHINAPCTLTATPATDYAFYCWKKNGQILSNAPSYTFQVKEDTVCLEACFFCTPVSQLTANYANEAGQATQPDSSSVFLSWSQNETGWDLLKQFEIDGEAGGIATDGNYLYVTYPVWDDLPFMFGKYTLDGQWLESFNLEGIPNAFCLAYDGTDFYCNYFSLLSDLCRIDLDNRMVLDHTEMGDWFGMLAYDPEYDGFWLGQDYQTYLCDRQGHRIKSSPRTLDYLYGSTYITSADGNPHLLLTRATGVYDYDVTNNIIFDRPLLSFGEDVAIEYGSCLGNYEGEEILYIASNHSIRMYRIHPVLTAIAPIESYRLYRADSEGNTVLLADGIHGSSYTDTTWSDALAGIYRFGIGMVFANGNESEVIWSDQIVKTDYGVNDIQAPSHPTIQKIVENGRLYLLVNGKKYTVMGQEVPNR